MHFSPLSLPFKYGDYEPIISEEIMRFHYEKHYLGYLSKLNDAIKKYPQYFNMSTEEILENIYSLPLAIRKHVQNNGGGVLNHELFWKILNPKADPNLSNIMQKIIFESFMAVDNFKKWFFDAANSHFGSGWVWLVVDKDRKLQIYTTANQDSPYMKGDIPILGIDLWEHSYYLQYKNLRTEYLEKVWTIIDWTVVETNYHDAITKTAT